MVKKETKNTIGLISLILSLLIFILPGIIGIIGAIIVIVLAIISLSKGHDKKWMPIVAIVLGALILFAFVFSETVIKSDEHQESFNEYKKLLEQNQIILNEISLMESQCSRKGFVYYNELSTEELEEYLVLLRQLEESNTHVKNWITSNEITLKENGLSDLQISEQVREINDWNTDNEDRIKKVALTLNERQEYLDSP